MPPSLQPRRNGAVGPDHEIGQYSLLTIFKRTRFCVRGENARVGMVGRNGIAAFDEQKRLAVVAAEAQDLSDQNEMVAAVVGLTTDAFERSGNAREQRCVPLPGAAIDIPELVRSRPREAL